MSSRSGSGSKIGPGVPVIRVFSKYMHIIEFQKHKNFHNFKMSFEIREMVLEISVLDVLDIAIHTALDSDELPLMQ